MSLIRSLFLMSVGFTLIACGSGSSSRTTTNPTPTTPTLTASNGTIDEGAGTVTVTVTADQTSTNDMSVSITSSDGSAVAGSDYQAINATLQIAAGSQSASFTITVLDDSVNEPDETFTLNFSNATNADLGTASVTITITDDDPVVTPSLTAANVSIDEGAGTATLTVNASAQATSPISVDLSSSNGSASAGSDYQALNTTLQIPTGSQSASTTVTIIDDSTDEPNENFTVSLSNPSNATIGTNSITVTIADNDSPNALPTLSMSNVTVDEDSGTATVTVTASAQASSPISVTVNTGNGSASAGSDYQGINTTLQIPTGSQTGSVDITIIDDGADEPNETFNVMLTNATNANISTNSIVVTINDNDVAQNPSLTAANVTVNEDAGTATITVNASAQATSPISVNLTSSDGTATAGSDYQALNTTVQIPVGSQAGNTTVNITNDAVAESTETFTVTLSNATNATINTNSITVTINDDDAEPSLTAANVSVAEGDGTATITVTASAQATSPISVELSSSNGSATAGSDYQALNTTVQIPVGSQSGTADVTITDDADEESTESFTVTLSNATNATIDTNSVTVTINDNDTEPSLTAANVTVDEDAGTATITVDASIQATSPISVDLTSSNGTATAGSDYQALNTTVQIPIGSQSGTADVTITDDADEESTETFTVTLSNATNATIGTNSITVSISDDDTAVGIENRPSNTTCVAPTRTTTGGSLGLVDAFPNLPGLNFPLKVIQAPGENNLYGMQREGAIRRWTNNASTSSISTYLNISVATPGEGGLLGMAFDPNWPTRKHLYVSYTVDNGNFRSRLSRLIITNDSSLPATYTEQILFEIDQPEVNHNGGDIAFGADGSLYWGLGDGGGSGDPDNHSQSTDNLLGSMVRVDVLGVNFPSPGYNIPGSNPFSGNARCDDGYGSQNCPEIYAWGFRNPYRWSFDEPTGDLWMGDVGQDTREEVNIVTLGNNYGWRCREGTTNFNTSGCNLGSLVDPVHDYGHMVSQGSITGGYVYRGSSAGTLSGRYIFADFLSRRIYYLTGSQGAGFSPVEITQLGDRISGFGIDSQGEVFVLPFSSNARVYRFDGNGGTLQDNVPNSLAATGCVNQSNPQLPSSGLVPYAPAAPFWSDNADKDRWVGLPNGANIDVQADGDFAFPTGTVLMKNFSVGNQLVETRLFMRHPDGDWAGYTYQWNGAQTSATRVNNGTTVSVGGQNWIIPSQADCLTCHTEAAGFSLGVETAQLNSDFLYPGSGVTDNQLEVFNHIDMFSVDVAEPVSQLDALVDPFDATADLDERARAYLHSNCAGCHQPNGPTQSAMDLRYDRLLSQTQTCDVAPTEGDLGIANARIIAPGDASRSVLVSRVDRRDGFAMPPLASDIVDDAGVTLLTDWINQLTNCM